VAIEPVPGVTWIAVSCAAVIVAAAEPDTDHMVALIVEVPDAVPVTRPEELTVAKPVTGAFHVTWLDTSWVVPSL
jgi:hypothetical protein